MHKNEEKDYTVSMENAEASVRMEGNTVTPEMRDGNSVSVCCGARPQWRNA